MTDDWGEDTPDHTLVCLHSGADPADWFTEQVQALGALTCRARILDGADPEAVQSWASDVAAGLAGLGRGPVHLLATGANALGAITVAARHPALVTSLVLGDPEVDPTAPGYRELLAQVLAPSLVIASVPDPGVDVTQPQSIAGGIDNGVFVVIDGGAVPAHRERAESFNEWVTAFTVIAEGLDAIASHRQEEANV